MLLQVFYPLLQWTMPCPYSSIVVFPTLDGKILFYEVALLHLKQLIFVLSTGHPNITRDDSLLLGVCFEMPYSLLLRVRYTDFGSYIGSYIKDMNKHIKPARID